MTIELPCNLINFPFAQPSENINLEICTSLFSVFCTSQIAEKCTLLIAGNIKAMVNLGSSEFEHIEESFNRQFYKHIDWMYEAIEAGIRFNHDQVTANAHYMDIRRVSTKRIILMANKIVKQVRQSNK